MLDLFGRGYVLDHVLAQLKIENRDRSYKQYIADVLQLIGENAARMVAGSYVSQRWSAYQEPEDNRTGDEIALDIITRAGLTLGGE